MKTRCFSASLLKRKLSNAEEIDRDLLSYSPSSGNVFCFYCKLFGGSNTTALASSGFDDWKHPESISQHEMSDAHFENVKLCTAFANEEGWLIESQHIKLLQQEEERWKGVIIRVIEAVRFLAERGLAFRGDSHDIGHPKNGNFLGIIELLSRFDPFLADCLARYGNKGTGKPSYLSQRIMEEVILMLSSQVTKLILISISNAKYFSIIVDSTPDVSHIDQLTFVLRYIKDGEPVERFITFTPIKSHKSKSLTTAIIETMNSLNLDIKYCFGQSYDNASNMSGKYSAVQARIKEINKCALYVPCTSHSLNLVGNAAAQCCLQAVSFFSTVQEVYTFLAASTQRWNTMQSKLSKSELVVKKICDTRWSGRHDAIRALVLAPRSIKETLDEIALDEDKTLSIRNDATTLSEKLESLEFALMAVFWNDLLKRIHKSNLSLQTVSLTIPSAIDLLNSLELFISWMRNREEYQRYLDKAKTFLDSTEQQFKDEMKRKKIRPRLADESATKEVELVGGEKFYIGTYLPIIDSLQTELSMRKTSYDVIEQRFGFICALRTEEISEGCKALTHAYPGQFDDDMEHEMMKFFNYAKETASEIHNQSERK